jgi:modulator of FtsH protease
MSAYDVAAWNDFANTVAGGAAALAGLMFVGLSLNLTEVLNFEGVAARAAATLGLTVAILLVAVFVATPGQDHRVVAAELGLVGAMTAVGVSVGTRYQRSSPHRNRALLSMLLLFIPGLLLIAAAVSLWCQAGGGLYWVTAAVATGFASASANAWVLLVEIKR